LRSGVEPRARPTSTLKMVGLASLDATLPTGLRFRRATKRPDHPIPPHPPVPHHGAPQPPPDWGWAIGRDDPVPELALAAAGTLNCLTRVVPLHLGQWGTSLEPRTRVSKAWSQGSHLNSYIGMGVVLSGRSRSTPDRVIRYSHS
jgi:hypothetical protein